MAFFVKHPPRDGLPPPVRRDRDLFTLGETPEQQAAIRLIDMCEAQFDQTGNPIEAINAFVHAHRAGLYPPLWVLDFIGERFLKAGPGGLDRAFGFLEMLTITQLVVRSEISDFLTSRPVSACRLRLS